MSKQLHRIGKEALIGLTLAFTALPVCLSSGVLVYSQFGADAVARGVVAGLFGIVIGGAVLGTEGEPADRMWITVGGSASVRLRVPDARGSRRLVSLATGTTVGEMALVQLAKRRPASSPTTTYNVMNYAATHSIAWFGIILHWVQRS